MKRISLSLKLALLGASVPWIIYLKPENILPGGHDVMSLILYPFLLVFCIPKYFFPSEEPFNFLNTTVCSLTDFLIIFLIVKFILKKSNTTTI